MRLKSIKEEMFFQKIICFSLTVNEKSNIMIVTKIKDLIQYKIYGIMYIRFKSPLERIIENEICET